MTFTILVRAIKDAIAEMQHEKRVADYLAAREAARGAKP